MPKATVLAIVLQMDGDTSKVLLTKRSIPPFQDQWCLPGGHIDAEETASQAVKREVMEETGLEFEGRFFHYFDEIIPEENIHAVVLAFEGPAKGTLTPDLGEVAAVKWVALHDALGEDLAFDHRTVLTAYLEKEKAELSDKTGILQELNYLRAEVLNRFGERNKVLSYTIILAGTFMGLSQNEFIDYTVLLIYPILGTFLAALWSHNDNRISQIGEYVRTKIEPRVPGLNWQNHLLHYYEEHKKGLLFRKLQESSVMGIFLISFFASIFLAVTDSQFTLDSTTIILLVLNVLSLIITWIFIRERRKSYNKKKKK